MPSRANFGRPTPGSLLKGVVPDAEFLYLSSVALKEHLGLLLYRLRGWS
jgi:hypothetical protein